MLYTVQAHENQTDVAQSSIEESSRFELVEEIAFGAFQVEGPDNAIHELQSMDGIYAANREGPIRFGDT